MESAHVPFNLCIRAVIYYNVLLFSALFKLQGKEFIIVYLVRGSAEKKQEARREEWM